MDAAVQKCLGDVQCAHAGLLLERLQGEHELVHAGAVVGEVVMAPQAAHQIVCVQNGIPGCLRDALAPQGEDVGQRPDHHQEIAVKRLDVAHAVRLAVPAPALGQAFRPRAGQIGDEQGLAAHRAAAGAAAAVGGGEGLVQV